jgi:hypothetical protein
VPIRSRLLSPKRKVERSNPLRASPLSSADCFLCTKSSLSQRFSERRAGWPGRSKLQAVTHTAQAPGGMAGGRFPSLSSTSSASSTSCEAGIGLGSLSSRISPAPSVGSFFFSVKFMPSIRVRRRRWMFSRCFRTQRRTNLSGNGCNPVGSGGKAVES